MKPLWKRLSCLALFLATHAHAGGPLGVCPVGVGAPVKYPGQGTVTLNYDLGTLGALTNSQAGQLVTEAVSLWTNVGTSTVNLARGSNLPVDVTAMNYTAYGNNFTDGLNPVIYDTDGSIIDMLRGTGAKNSILGFAGSSYSWNSTTCWYTEGRAVINGFIPIDATTMKVVLAHEVGHLIGLDHTQLDNTQGLVSAYPSNYPLMYPIAYRDYVSLHEDDAAAVSAHYPDATLGSVYGELSGTFTQINGTPIKGANLWAEETTTHKLFSIVSDYLVQNTGYFKLLLPAGNYTLHAEAVQTNFSGGSSVGPYSEIYPTDPSFQPPLYVGGVAMAAVTLGNAVPTQITITAGCAATAGFKLDGTGNVNGNCSAPCTYTLSSTSLSTGAAAAVGNVSVTATGGCAWSAASNAAWIAVTSGASGSGNGQVGYSIAANPGASSRTGTLTIAGKTFTVTQNGAGTLPAAPTIGAATAGNGTARVAFAPGAIGSGTLLNYTAMCGNRTATGNSPIMVLGLTNGTPYTCKVRTTSTVGIGSWSALSNAVTPSASLALPAAPAIGTAIASNGSARVAFTPGVIGSGALLNYTVMCGNIAAAGSGSPIMVGGLINGTAYRCKARTTSTAGIGPWSALSNAVTPAASKASRRYDFNGDGKADILWRNTATGGNKIWFMNGAIKIGSPNTNTLAIGWSAAGVADFNGDGKADILWRNAAGQNFIWLMSGATRLSGAAISSAAAPWAVAGTGDFNGDGKADILWRNTATGENQIWFMNGITRTETVSTTTLVSGWSVAEVADFNGNGKADILWRNAAGQSQIWLMNGATRLSGATVSPVMAAPWTFAGAGDFNGDGKADILWRNTATGGNQIWFMNGMTRASTTNTTALAVGWIVAQAADFNDDGKADILWRNPSSGATQLWPMNGAARVSFANLAPAMPVPWMVAK